MLHTLHNLYHKEESIMNTKLATTQIRITEWAAIIKDCKFSGMKVDDYCQLHDISGDAYYYWLRKVKTVAL